MNSGAVDGLLQQRICSQKMEAEYLTRLIQSLSNNVDLENRVLALLKTYPTPTKRLNTCLRCHTRKANLPTKAVGWYNWDPNKRVQQFSRPGGLGVGPLSQTAASQVQRISRVVRPVVPPPSQATGRPASAAQVQQRIVTPRLATPTIVRPVLQRAIPLQRSTGQRNRAVAPAVRQAIIRRATPVQPRQTSAQRIVQTSLPSTQTPRSEQRVVVRPAHRLVPSVAPVQTPRNVTSILPVPSTQGLQTRSIPSVPSVPRQRPVSVIPVQRPVVSLSSSSDDDDYVIRPIRRKARKPIPSLDSEEEHARAGPSHTQRPATTLSSSDEETPDRAV